MKALTCILLFSATLFAQDAKIMIVEKQDSDHLNSAYKDYQAAKKRWEDVKNYVAKKYTNPDGNKVIEGWEKVQFSADFRALVPDSSQFASHTNCFYNSGITWTPATSVLSSTGVTSTGTGVTLNGNVAVDGDLKVNGDGIATELTTKEPRKP